MHGSETKLGIMKICMIVEGNSFFLIEIGIGEVSF